jgi:hypothetical protein
MGMVPVEPRTRRLLLLGERKVKGLLEKDEVRGSMIMEMINIKILAAIIVFIIPSSF